MYKLWFVFLLICSLSACSSVRGAKTNEYSEHWQTLGSASNIHLFPISRTFSFKAGAVDDVWKELNQQLENLGHEVEVESFIHGQRLVVVDPVEEIKAQQKTNTTPDTDRDLYVFPSIVERVADLEGKLAKWDGVNQSIQMVGGTGWGTWSGQQMVYSLRLDVFDARTEWVMTTFGGISLPIYAYIPNREIRKKDSLFGDENDYQGLVRGVAKALAPLTITEQ